MRFSIAAIALVATAVSAQYATTTAAVTSYAASNATSSAGPTVYSTVSGAPSGTGSAPTHTPSFVNAAPANEYKIGAAALAAVAALVL